MKLLFKRKRPEVEILHYGIGYAVQVNKLDDPFFVGVDGFSQYGTRSYCHDKFVFHTLDEARHMRDRWDHHLEPIEDTEQ